jgi:hypothetical protein
MGWRVQLSDVRLVTMRLRNETATITTDILAIMTETLTPHLGEPV